MEKYLTRYKYKARMIFHQYCQFVVLVKLHSKILMGIFNICLFIIVFENKVGI